MAEKKRRFWQPFHDESSDTVGWIDYSGNTHGEDHQPGPHHHPNHNKPDSDSRNKTNPNTGTKKPKGGLFR